MGDYFKMGIFIMFNIGMVIGVCINVFGEGFLCMFIFFFVWGGKQGFQIYCFDKAFEMMDWVMECWGYMFLVQECFILLWVFEDICQYCKWEKED